MSALPVIVALSFILGLPPAVGAASGPHAFMHDPAGCVRCHETPPVKGEAVDYTTLAFTKDLVTLCEECHAEKVSGDMHPVDVRPAHAVPAELHLDNYFTITCVTCHDPHGKNVSERPFVPQTWFDRLGRAVRRQRGYRTFLLRRSNVGGDLCLSCHRKTDFERAEEIKEHAKTSDFVGSAACKECHQEKHNRWRGSLHARYVGDARADPKVVRATFDGNKPFPRSTLLYTLGEHWTQRYVVSGSAEPMVRPDIWSIQSKQWISAGTYNRSWFKYCAGCHVTGFDPYKGTMIETGIGCEACHGPGRRHIETTDPFDIVNPAVLSEQRRDMICEACHTSGHDRSGQYRFPVGYLPGDDLTLYYKGLVPKPGQEMDTYTGDGSYDDRHRQLDYWIDHYNITSGILCDVCKNFRQAPVGTSDDVALDSSQLCATCHDRHWKKYRAHAGHSSDQAGCIDCHTPPLTADRKAYSIHDHRFQFGTPVTDRDLPTIEERCRRCHGASISMARFRGRRLS